MKIRIAKSAKDPLLKYALEKYGIILREIDGLNEMDELSLIQEIERIVSKYSPKVLQEYRVIVKRSSKPQYDYDLRLRKKKIRGN